MSESNGIKFCFAICYIQFFLTIHFHCIKQTLAKLLPKSF